MNIGDLVMTPSGVARITVAGVFECYTTRGTYDTREIHILTVAEAFEIAGHPVPEGARIGLRGNEWIGRVSPYLSNERSGQGFQFKDGWTFYPCEPGAHYEPQIDLRRTPVSDTWDALPPYVREKVEEALNG